MRTLKLFKRNIHLRRTIGFFPDDTRLLLCSFVVNY